MIHVLEALVGLWVAWLLRKALIAYYVRKRICPACNGHGVADQVMQVDPLVTRMRICHACNMRGLRLMRTMKAFMSGLMLLAGITAAFADDLYVATTGSDTNNNCRTRAAPCLTGQHAVDQIPFATVH